MAKILYLGSSANSATSRYRAEALSRLGHQVVIADPYLVVEKQLQSPWLSALHFRTGYRLLLSRVRVWLLDFLSNSQDFDLAWIDSGELIDFNCLQLLANARLLTILYNHDDPTGKRDGHRFDTLLKSLRFYDLCVGVRKESINDFNSYGVNSAMAVWRSYDEVVHAPYSQVSDIPQNLRSEVAFIGTWMRDEGRDIFLLDLVERGIPISIWGQRWEKSPVWEKLEKFHRGGNLSGRDYVGAIQGAKVCLGMLSKGNRDLHTTRSLEIPYAGGVLCAERTIEHMQLFTDEVEAVFWDDVDECAELCRKLLDDDEWRESVRLAGWVKIRSLNVGNEDICEKIMNVVLSNDRYHKKAISLNTFHVAKFFQRIQKNR